MNQIRFTRLLSASWTIPLLVLILTGNSLASEQNGESESADVKEKQAEPSSDSKDSPLDPVNNQNETREDEDDDDEDEIFDGEAESTNVAPRLHSLRGQKRWKAKMSRPLNNPQRNRRNLSRSRHLK